MAELNVFANNLERELTCSICEEIFTNPRTLKCLHAFCLKCISDWNELCRQERRPLTCPSCRSIERLEGDNVSNLPLSFYLDSLLQVLRDMKTAAKTQDQQELPDCVSCKKRDKLVAFCPQCQGFICVSCMGLHQTLTTFQEHQATMFSDFNKENVNIHVKNQMYYCPKRYHSKNKLDFYCTTCNQCICLKCNATEHKLHHVVTVEEAAQEMKVSIKRDMDRANKMKEHYEEELEHSKQDVARIEQEINAAMKKVTDEVEQHVKILREHETAVIETLQIKLQQRKAKNDDEQRELRDVIESVSEIYLRGQALLDENGAHFIVKNEQERSLICEKLLYETPMLLTKSFEHFSSVRYSPNPQVTQTLQDIGIVVESVTNHSRCSIESLNDVRCGFVNRFEVVTRNSQKEQSMTCEGSIDVQIKDSDGMDVEKELNQSESGKYTVKYRAEKPCNYTIYVKINGQEIKNSPQTVKARDLRGEFRPVKDFPRVKGNSSKFWSLAVSERGVVAIADLGVGRIVMFNVDGEYLRHFGEEGTDEGKLSNPRAVVFNEDRLLVTDNNNVTGRIKEFDLSGTYCRTIYKEQGVELFGMCATNEIAVCYQSPIKNRSGITFLNKQSGQEVRKFRMIDDDEVPKNIAYDSGKYFVSYPAKHCIRVLDSNGMYLLYKFGKKGNGNGEFKFPRGLAVIRDAILVCDDDNYRVQMLNQDGRFIRSFGSRGSGLGQMKNPMDVAVAPDGQVFVVEWDNYRVQVWR